VAPLCYEHSINGEFFEGWFESQYLPWCQRVLRLFWIGLLFIVRACLVSP
jgi:hypothetical protein